MSEIAEHIKRGILPPHERVLLLHKREGKLGNSPRGNSCPSGEGVRIIFVTHFYELQRRLMESRKDDVLFLRAERKEDGTRTYRIIPGAPEKTSYADEVYSKIFGEELPKAEVAE